MFSSGAENKPFWTFHQPRIAFLCWSAASHLLPFYWLILLLEPVLWSIPGAAGQALPASKRAGKQTRHLMERWGESCRHTHPGVPNLHWYSRNKKSIPFQDVVFFPAKMAHFQRRARLRTFLLLVWNLLVVIPGSKFSVCSKRKALWFRYNLYSSKTNNDISDAFIRAKLTAANKNLKK